MEEKSKKRGRPRCFEKEEAIQNAINLFLRKGFEGTSTDDLVRELGINKPSLYSAFGNKEQFFLLVLEKYYGKYLSFFEDLIQKKLPAYETIAAWLNWFIENYRNQDNSWGCLVVNSTTICKKEYPLIVKQLKEFHNKNEELLVRYFRAAILAGELPKGTDVKALSQFYNAVVQGMAVLGRGQGNIEALQNVASTALAAWPMKR